jgi:hypothetical protein
MWSSQEHMTNKDLIDTLKTFGVDDSGQVKANSPVEKQEIYGPGLKDSEKPQPKPVSEEDKKNIRGSYPHIYGPEYVAVPGKAFEPPGFEQTEKPYSHSSTESKNKPYCLNPPGFEQTEKPYSQSSTETENEPYYFKPDFQKAFPVNGPPQPFLTDFSKFQK